MSLPKKYLILFTFIVMTLYGCVSTTSHKAMKAEGFNNEISINPEISDKEFVERVELALVRQTGFRNSMVKMKSEELKRLIFNHDIEYGNFSPLVSWVACDYCYVNVQTEVVRTSSDKAVIKHSRFIPRRTDRGIRPMIRETLANEIKEGLRKLDSKIGAVLIE